MTFISVKKWSVELMVFSLLGCGETNLTGYRPAREHASVPVETGKTVERDVHAESDPRSIPAVAESHADSISGDPDFLPVSAIAPVNVVSSIQALMSIPAPEVNTANGSAALCPPKTISSSGNDAAVPVKPKQIEILIPDKKFQTEPKSGALRVSFDDLDLLKVLNMDPVVDNADQLMPDWLKGLNGKNIRIRGFMYPTYETEGIERFVLARDNQICCFGRDPKIYDLVQIDLKSGKTTNYIPATRAFDVVGRLKIEMLAQDGKPYGLYVMEDATVIDR